MAELVLDPDPASTIEASPEYIAAWLAEYGNQPPYSPPPAPEPPPEPLPPPVVVNEIVLDPDPRSTYEADDAYREAWLAAYGNNVYPPWEPPPPGVLEPYVIDEAVLPDYLKRDSIDTFIKEAVGDFALGTVVQEFQFQVPTVRWECPHTLGRILVDVVTADTNGDEIVGDVTYENGLVVIEWFYPTTGTARLST